jgi:hypothetical protein
MASVTVKIEGLEDLLKKLSPDLYAGPLKKFLERAAIRVQSGARTLAPVDTGRLRSSIMYEVDSHDPPMYAVVGTDVFYAPYQELGTRPHFVPASAIGVWASRHKLGNTGLMVSGKAHPFLKPSFESAHGDIQSLVSALGQDIASAWGK